VAYLLLALMVSHDRVTRVVTVIVSGCGLVVGAVNLVLPSTLTSVLAHSASIIAFVVLGYVVARAVFAPGPVNTHRITRPRESSLNSARARAHELVECYRGGFETLRLGKAGRVGSRAR